MEVWELYDKDLVNTHKIISCKEEVPAGYYHLSIEVWIINSKKELLLLKNAMDYSIRYPGSWNCIGGNLQAGESIEKAVKRIIKKRIGTIIKMKENIIIKPPVKRAPHKYAYITCIFSYDIDLSSIKFEDEKSTEAKFVDKDELIKMCKNGELAYYLVNRIENEIIEHLS